MILVIHERKAPLFRGRPDFTLAERYGGKIKPVLPGEIGFYFDEVSLKQVRVIASARIPLKDNHGNNILGWLMTEQVYESMNVQKNPIGFSS